MQYAGFWLRTAAITIDAAVLMVISAAVFAALGIVLSGELWITVSSVVLTLVSILYFPFLESTSLQATPGKALVGLQVGNAEGQRTSFIRAFLRNLGKIVSQLTFYVGFLLAAFTSRKQALHDMFVGCVVTRSESSPGFFKGLVYSVVSLVLGGIIAYMLFPVGKMAAFQEAAKEPAVKTAAPAPRPPASAAKPAAKAPAAAPAATPAVVASAAPAAAAAPAKAALAAGELAKGTVVIPGTFTWDAETNVLGAAGSDLWWQQQSDTERLLSPGKGAQIARLPGASFESLSPALIAQAPFSTQGIKGSNVGSLLEPGAVIALRTVEGNLAKLRVVRYRNAHDTSFPGSAGLRAEWVKLVRSGPDRPNYHIELEYALYAGVPAAATATPAAVTAAAVSAPIQLAQAKPEGNADAKPAAKRAPRKPRAAASAIAAAPAPVPVVVNPRFNDLMSAVLYRDGQAVSQLLGMGKWPDKPDSRGWTPLIAAAYIGERASAEALLKAGANPNYQGPGVGATPLALARERNDAAMITLLQRHGAR